MELAEAGQRRPEVRRDKLEPSKAFRHHPDNLERRAVHPDRAVEHAGIARIVLGPGAMAEDNDRATARFVVGRERPATLGADAEDTEEVSRDERALPSGPRSMPPRRTSRERLGEHVRFADERFVRAREGSGSSSADC